jgi:hypothetical protein
LNGTGRDYDRDQAGEQAGSSGENARDQNQWSGGREQQAGMGRSRESGKKEQDGSEPSSKK